MTKENLVKELEKHKNQKGIENWKKFNQKWISYGIGLTQLRAIAKEIPNNHQLSLQCWDTSIYDLKIISILIEEPLKVTRQQIESQIQESVL